MTARHLRNAASWSALALSAGLALGSAGAATAAPTWVQTWGASLTAPYGPEFKEPSVRFNRRLSFDHETVRQIAHVSVGGAQVRIRVSNRFGPGPLDVGSAHIALRRTAGATLPGSDRTLTFSGASQVRIPAGATVLSDPAPLAVADGADLAVSLYLPQAAPPVSAHYAAAQTTYIAKGDHAADADLAGAVASESWYWLSGIDVLAPRPVDAVVTFGDSITDGAHSTLDANHRWPDLLAARLRSAGRRVAVVNAGLGGNRILCDGSGPWGPAWGPNALARFERDALQAAGERTVMVLEAINDLGNSDGCGEASAERIIWGYKQLIARAHAHRVRLVMGTLVPAGGAVSPHGSDSTEARRQAINAWIRQGQGFDGVVDFDRAVRDPSQPRRMNPAFDSGDHLHPNDAGYAAMAQAIDLRIVAGR